MTSYLSIFSLAVPSPVPPPRSPKHFGDEMMDLGSPIGNSTRLNETYIEEHSIKSFDVNNLSPMKMHSTPIKTSVTTITSTTSTTGNTSDHLNPFDEDDEDEGLKGTLSGRDPFENEVSFVVVVLCIVVITVIVVTDYVKRKR